MVSADWLFENLSSEDVVAVDATWYMPGDAIPHLDKFIEGPGFDIDAVADHETALPHMLPSADTFEKAVREMGINRGTHIVCYDRHGLFSAPRLWWTFRTFGHENVSVLDGGIPTWVAAGHPTVSEPVTNPSGNFVANFNDALYRHVDDVRAAIGSSQIVDARPPGRFAGTSPEPRKGLSSGHMPNAFNIPFSKLKTSDGLLKNETELLNLFKSRQIDISKGIITTCGSGITASGLALALARLGVWDAAVYDGSWSEWAASDNCPIVKAG
jgi:thiosulfate/3-mercaptopyruvate sulfurtransferase